MMNNGFTGAATKLLTLGGVIALLFLIPGCGGPPPERDTNVQLDTPEKAEEWLRRYEPASESKYNARSMKTSSSADGKRWVVTWYRISDKYEKPGMSNCAYASSETQRPQRGTEILSESPWPIPKTYKCSFDDEVFLPLPEAEIQAIKEKSAAEINTALSQVKQSPQDVIAILLNLRSNDFTYKVTKSDTFTTPTSTVMEVLQTSNEKTSLRPNAEPVVNRLLLIGVTTSGEIIFQGWSKNGK